MARLVTLAVALALLHACTPALAFQVPCFAQTNSRRVCVSMSVDPPMSRSQVIRDFAYKMVVFPVLARTAPSFAEEAATGAAVAEEESDQVLDVDKINGKKAAVLGGALVVADILSGLVTGRSVLRIVGGNEDPEDWKVKVVNKLLEKEKKEAAARMGVSVTTESQPSAQERGPSATGDYARTDPFEIAKQKYKKKESIEDLQRKLLAPFKFKVARSSRAG